MAQRLAKTPYDLFKGAEIKPDAAVDNQVGDVRVNVKTLPGYPYPATQQLPYGGRKVKEPFYGSAKSKAQAVANKYEKPTFYREEDYFGPTRTSRYPGQKGIKLPDQWKYKPSKTPGGLFDQDILNSGAGQYLKSLGMSDADIIDKYKSTSDLMAAEGSDYYYEPDDILARIKEEMKK